MIGVNPCTLGETVTLYGETDISSKATKRDTGSRRAMKAQSVKVGKVLFKKGYGYKHKKRKSIVE